MGLPEEVAVRDYVGEGVAVAAMWAGSGVASHGAEVVGVVSVECMAGDKLEAR